MAVAWRAQAAGEHPKKKKLGLSQSRPKLEVQIKLFYRKEGIMRRVTGRSQPMTNPCGRRATRAEESAPEDPPGFDRR